jgi:PAS domain S-box-containing protein
MKIWRCWLENRTTRRDLLATVVITLGAFVLGVRFDLYERLTVRTRYLERWQIDEMPIALLAFSLCCIWLLLRRARQLAAEMVRRQQVATALQESEARYRAVVEGSLQGVYIQSHGVVRFANQALAKIFGYDSADELLGQEIWALVAPHERPRLAGYSQLQRRGAVAPSRYEWQGRRQDGTLIWLESLVSYLSWNGHPALLTAVIDITARKQRDEERRKLAYELHDGIAQLLLSAQQHLETFDGLRQEDDGRAQRQFNLGCNRLQRAIVEMRRLLAGLRPAPLEARGLIPAVQQYLEELAQEAGWEVEFRVATGPLCLAPEQEAALFRIIQEALTNAWKHANTSRLRMALQTTDVPWPTLSVVIKDWGTGFPPARMPERGPVALPVVPVRGLRSASPCP